MEYKCGGGVSKRTAEFRKRTFLVESEGGELIEN
jgi:hypothetical protein